MADQWFLVVDTRRARLMHGSTLRTGRLHVDAHEVLENRWEEHERGRPSRLAGKTGQYYAHWGHEDEERLQRFARDVVVWIDEQLERRQIAELTVFAPPRLLGALRQEMPPRIAERLRVLKADLGKLTPADLVQHAAVTGLLGVEQGA